MPFLDDLLSVTIHRHDGDEPTEYVEMRQKQQQNKTTRQPDYLSTVEEVSPEDAIKKEKCIVFTDTIQANIPCIVYLVKDND